jgi:RNA polymerase sigma-70 factor (TIGR02960 family)
MSNPAPGLDPPEPTRLGEVVWLKPYPDVLAGQEPDPQAHHETKETISLAFVTALQLLPPRQRTVVILCDVLGFSAKEVTRVMDTSTEAVTSALKRARAALTSRLPPSGHPPAPAPNSAAERKLLAQLSGAWENSDVAAIVALLTEDAWVTMPPAPLQYQGRTLAAQFFAAVAFRQDRSYRLIPTRANGQPAFGVYVHDPHTRVAHANGLLVFTLAGDQISAITRFDNSVLPRFGLPRLLPD